jgi:tetratricopeptide (TPR) repeat protein
MKRILKQAGMIVSLGALCWAQEPDQATAYYQYTLARHYANMAVDSLNGGGDYVNQAITAYKAAIAADPRSPVIAEELTDFYIQTNRVGQARTEAEAAVAKNPNDLASHRMLARIYMQLVQRRNGQNGQQSIDPAMLRRATEEFTKVTELDPNDVGALVFLARLQLTSGSSDTAAKSLDKALAIDPKNEDALNVRALIYEDKGDFKNMLEMYQRSAEVRPSAESLRRLADAYMKMKEYDLANEAIKRAIAMSPEDAKDLRKALAGNLIRENKYEEAVSALEASASDDPGDPEPWMMIMQIEMQLGNLPKAREAATKAAAADPENTDVLLNEVALLQAEGKPKEAIKSLQGVLDKTAKRTYTAEQRQARIKQLGQLALLNRIMDQPAESVVAYREIVTLNPEMEADVEADIIDTLRGGKKLPEAQKEADAAIKKFPMDRNVRIAKATLDADMGRVDPAVADVRKLLDGSDDRRIYLTIAELYQKGKRWNDGAKALDEAEKLSKDQDEKLDVWFARGAMFERQKNIPQAEAEFRKVLKVVPDHAQALNYLGYMLTDRNTRLNEALDMIQKAVAREPSNGAYLDSLGWVYYRLGRYAEAEQQIKRAVDLNPGDPTMQDHYAEALMQQKKIREAVAAWEESLRQWQASAPAEKDDAEINKVRSKLEQAKKQLAR